MRAFIIALAGGLIAVALVWGHMANAQTDSNPAEPRGALLYSTYCIGCHTTEIHWRDKKLATNWATLKNQVRRWSSNTGVTWDESDILEVTRHLNALYYLFPIAGEEIAGSPRWHGAPSLTFLDIPRVFANF
jgi:hypothetical protein